MAFDPLSEITRRNRRMLMAFASGAILTEVFGVKLTPESFAGMKIEAPEHLLPIMLGIGTLYFLVTFAALIIDDYIDMRAGLTPMQKLLQKHRSEMFEFLYDDFKEATRIGGLPEDDTVLVSLRRHLSDMLKDVEETENFTDLLLDQNIEFNFYHALEELYDRDEAKKLLFESEGLSGKQLLQKQSDAVDKGRSYIQNRIKEVARDYGRINKFYHYYSNFRIVFLEITLPALLGIAAIGLLGYGVMADWLTA